MYRLRFVRIILLCLLTRPLEMMDAFRVSFFAIPFLDTDTLRLFTHTYGSYMGLCRWHFVFHSPLRNAAMKNGWFPVTTAEFITYRKAINGFSRVTVTSRLLCWNEKRFFLEQTFTVKGVVHAQGYLEGTVRSRQGAIAPATVFAATGIDGTSPPIPPLITRWLESRDEGRRTF